MSENNPQVLQIQMHPEKFVLHDGGIIGPYFIENIAAVNVTLNGAR